MLGGPLIVSQEMGLAFPVQMGLSRLLTLGQELGQLISSLICHMLVLAQAILVRSWDTELK